MRIGLVAVDYQRQVVFVKWLGAHAEYDKIDVKKVKYGD
jgi:mRNA interferase HigB